MKNIVEYIRKKDTIFCFMIFFIVFISMAQIVPISLSPDYVWNFQSIYKMYNGYKLYNDINVIVTPLFFYIGLMFFKIMGANFLTFNVYSAIINSLMITYIYKILTKLKCRKVLSFLTSLGIYIIIEDALISNGANYNFLALVLILIGIDLEIANNNKNNKWTNYLQGIISFLILFTKQNIGVFYLLAITVYKFWNDENGKEAIKNCIKQYITIGILGTLFLIYLKLSNTWDGFFYYVISGINDFTKNLHIPKMSNDDVFFFIIPIIVSILGVFGIKKKVFKEDENGNTKLLICASIASMGYIIPLANKAHILQAAVVNVIAIVYIIKLIFKSDIKISLNMIKFIFAILVIVNIIDLARIIYIWRTEKMIHITETRSPFFYTQIPESVYSEIETITSYIKEKQKEDINVIVIYELSGLYMIPINKNNKKFDCLNAGNLGSDAGQGVINEIKEMKNTEILIIKDDDKVFWQEPKEVREYIKENLEKIGEIEKFSIYRTK